MAATASTLTHLRRPRPMPGLAARREAPDDLGRYQFQVLAANVADTVMSIGGLIFDRAMAGWDVSVVIDAGTDRPLDDRPIRILGARVAKQLSDPDDGPALRRPNLLAVATDVMIRSDAVRRRVLAIGDDDGTAVLLWGRHHPTNLTRAFVAARHQPSAAAHVFKSQALVAARAANSHRADEAFYPMS